MLMLLAAPLCAAEAIAEVVALEKTYIFAAAQKLPNSPGLVASESRIVQLPGLPNQKKNAARDSTLG